MTLEQLLQQLKFDHLADQLETVCEQAASRDLDYREFLAVALQCEWAGGTGAASTRGSNRPACRG